MNKNHSHNNKYDFQIIKWLIKRVLLFILPFSFWSSEPLFSPKLQLLIAIDFVYGFPWCSIQVDAINLIFPSVLFSFHFIEIVYGFGPLRVNLFFKHGNTLLNVERCVAVHWNLSLGALEMHCPLTRGALGAIRNFILCSVPKFYLIFCMKWVLMSLMVVFQGFNGQKWKLLGGKENMRKKTCLNDPGTIRALRDCGLLKYFRLYGMR